MAAMGRKNAFRLERSLTFSVILSVWQGSFVVLVQIQFGYGAARIRIRNDFFQIRIRIRLQIRNTADKSWRRKFDLENQRKGNIWVPVTDDLN
jgi:hypothetical protein